MGTSTGCKSAQQMDGWGHKIVSIDHPRESTPRNEILLKGKSIKKSSRASRMLKFVFPSAMAPI